MGDCQNYGPCLGPYYNTGANLGDPKRDHDFDNPPYDSAQAKQRALNRGARSKAKARPGHRDQELSPTAFEPNLGDYIGFRVWV